MSVSLTGLDKEIQQLEQRIADDRAAFMSALSDCGQSMRETASSPKSLLAATAIGFVAGKLLFRPAKIEKVERHESPSKLGGALGVLAAGLSLMRPGYGAGGIARWAAQQLWERQKKRRAPAAPATVRRAGPAGNMPEVRMPSGSPRTESPAGQRR